MGEKELMKMLVLRGLGEGDVECVELSARQWWQLFRRLQQNRLVALCYTAAKEAGAPREVVIPWLAERIKAEERYQHKLEVQQEIVQLMQEHGIATEVLKGTHLAQYWPVPQCREFGDVDLFFYHRHKEADNLAREVLKVEVSDDRHHHTKYTYRGVTVESHYHLLNIHSPLSNREYENWLLADMPTPTFEVLFMLRHMGGHFVASRMTLRDLVDWHLATQALREEVDWQLVKKAVTHFGMEWFVGALTRVEQRMFGGESELQGFEVSEGVATRVEEDVFLGSHESEEYQGNGIGRLQWKLRRFKANRWKQQMVYNDSAVSLLLSTFGAHTLNPRSFWKKI